MQNTPPPFNSGTVRPKSLTVCGIINIILGALVLFSMISGLKQWLAPSTMLGNPMMDALLKDADYLFYIKVSTLPSVLAGLVLLVAGVGLLKAREWARKMSILWAVYCLVVSPIVAWYNFTTLFPKMFAVMQKIPPFNDDKVLQIFKFSMMAFVGLSVIFAVTYAIVLMFLLMRTKVRVFCIAASSKPTNLIA